MIFIINFWIFRKLFLIYNKSDEIKHYNHSSLQKAQVFSMLPLRTGPKQTEELEIDENIEGVGEQNQKLNKKTGEGVVSLAEGGTNLGHPLSLKKHCTRKVYLAAICILVGFLIIEYIAQIQINYHNTQRFIHNLKALRDYDQSTNTLNKDHQIPTGAVNFKRQQPKLNFKNNQPISAATNKKDNHQKVPIFIKGQEDAVLPTPPNDHTPVNDHPKPTIPPDPAINEILVVPPINPTSNQHRSVNDEVPQPANNEPISSNPRQSNLIWQNKPANMNLNQPPASPQGYLPAPSPPSTNPFNQESPEPQINVTPTIPPFVKPKQQNNSPWTTFAGITNDQLAKAREWRALTNIDPLQDDPLAKDEQFYYQSRYQISKYEELPFCIVVPTYNNGVSERYLRNIKSIVMQDYTNYHIVVIDDHSEDGTGKLISKHLASQKKVPPQQYKVIQNDEQKRAMANLRTAAKEHCRPEEIFMIVDGDDELLGRQVLKLFNAVFQEKKLWFVYSNFLSIAGTIGFSRPFPPSTMRRNNYRTFHYVTSHLRAFYTKLFLNIREEDLQDGSGEYLRAANDVAICIPILEQAHERVGYLPEITYFYNSNTGLNNHQIRLHQQRGNQRKIRQRQKYQRLENLLE